MRKVAIKCKLQLVLGRLFDLFWEGARSDKLQLGLLQMQITTSATTPVEYTVVSFKRVCFIVLDICASFASCKCRILVSRSPN